MDHQVGGLHFGIWPLEETTQFHYQHNFLAHGLSVIWINFFFLGQTAILNFMSLPDSKKA